MYLATRDVPSGTMIPCNDYHTIQIISAYAQNHVMYSAKMTYCIYTLEIPKPGIN